MLLSLFLLGTVWFWLLLGAAAIVIGICVTRESFGKATLCLLGFFGALMLFGDFNVIHWLAHNGTTFLIGLGAYLVLGVLWAFAKWFFFVRRLRDEYEDEKRSFLSQHGVQGDDVPEALKREWRERITHGPQTNRRLSIRGGIAFPPRARDYKGKITAWMLYWPWSLLVTIIDDPLRKLINAIFRMVQGAFQRISDNTFKGVQDDFTEAPPTAQGGNGAPPPGRPGDDVSDGRPRDAL